MIILFLRSNYEELQDGMIEVALDPQNNKAGDIRHVCAEVIS
jgi:hypothetical protein